MAQFTLKHGESVTAEGLPGGVGYRVTEEDDGAGYTTTASAAEGTIPCGDTATAAFVNHKDSPPAPGDSPENDKGTPETGGAASTGDGAKPWIYAGLAAAAAAILAGGIWIRARKKRAGKQPREMKREKTINKAKKKTIKKTIKKTAKNRSGGKDLLFPPLRRFDRGRSAGGKSYLKIAFCGRVV